LYFAGPSGALMPAVLSVENWVPLKPELGGVRDVALNHYPSLTHSNKPNLQFICNFVVINASEGSLSFQIFVISLPATICCLFLCYALVELFHFHFYQVLYQLKKNHLQLIYFYYWLFLSFTGVV
jgi:hypothetical protein